MTAPAAPRPAARWPELFADLTDGQTHAVEQTVAAERLEGWRPRREHVTDLVALATCDGSHADRLARWRSEAAALPVAGRRRLALPRPYLVTGTSVLRNNFGFRDGGQLREVEFPATAARLLQAHLGAATPVRSVDAEHILRLHGQVFGDVFGWAGQTRFVELSKNGDAFAPVAAIGRYLREVEIAVAVTDWPRVDPGRLAYALAAVYATYNHAHPFRYLYFLALCPSRVTRSRKHRETL